MRPVCVWPPWRGEDDVGQWREEGAGGGFGRMGPAGIRGTVYQLTHIHLLHGKLAGGAIEGAGANAPEAIPGAPVLAPGLLKLAVVPGEAREAHTMALGPGATVVTGTWEARKGGKGRSRQSFPWGTKGGCELGDSRPNLGVWSAVTLGCSESHWM